jgi:hypothetical protein
MKRYVYIIIAIVVIAIIAVVVIIFLKKGQGGSSFLGLGGLGEGGLPQVGTQGTNGGSGSQGGANSGGSDDSGSQANGAGGGAGASQIVLGQGSPAQTFGIVATGTALDYFVDASNTITVIQSDGTVITISGGATAVISSTTFSNIISAAFSYDGKKLFINAGDPADPQTSILTVSSGVWTSAAQSMQSPQWSPSDYRIAYLSTSANGRTSLATVNAAALTKASVTVFSLDATDLSLQWVSNAQFILSDKPTADNNGSIWLLNSTAGILTPMVYETPGAESVWGAYAGTSTMGLVFTDGNANSYNPSLEIMSASGAAPRALSFVTLPSKCLFASATTSVAASSGGTSTATTAAPSSTTMSVPYLYCGIPKDQAGLASGQLPDGYNMMSSFTSDQIVSVNLETGAESVLRDDATPHVDATDLKVANGILFFISRYDGQIYALTLGQ